MRHTGILRTWHDDKGFGFIAPSQGGRELFVHISAFARDGSRPMAGETLSYELGQGKDGKPQAVNVVRAAVGATKPARQVVPTSGKVGGKWLSTLVMVLVVMGIGTYGFREVKARMHRAELAAMPIEAGPEPAPNPTQKTDGLKPATSVSNTSDQCDGRKRCTQMTSCAEATWFIKHCPGTEMDGDGDGVPCEEQWCRGGGLH
ncbi:MAG: cold shock domain-containing protein [Aquabacterium sp.]